MPVTVLWLIVRFPRLKMPAPNPACPFAIVRLDSATVAPGATLNTRLVFAPLMVTPFAVGPVIVRFLSRNSSPVDRLMVSGPGPGMLNVIVSVVQASRIAWRSDPAPLSAVVVTTGVAGHGFTVWSVVSALRSDTPSPP